MAEQDGSINQSRPGPGRRKKPEEWKPKKASKPGRTRKHLDKAAKNAARVHAAHYESPPGFRTRIQLREILDISEKELKTAETLGTIRPSKYSPYRTPLYSDRAVQNYLNRKKEGSLWRNGGNLASLDPTSYSAEEAKAVLVMLEAGEEDLVKIIIATDLHPDVVMRIRQRYDAIKGGIFIPGDLLVQMNDLKRLQGSFPLKTAADVLEVMQLAEDDRICPTCRVNGSISLCAPCARDQFSPQPVSTSAGQPETRRDKSEAEVSSASDDKL